MHTAGSQGWAWRAMCKRKEYLHGYRSASAEKRNVYSVNTRRVAARSVMPTITKLSSITTVEEGSNVRFLKLVRWLVLHAIE